MRFRASNQVTHTWRRNTMDVLANRKFWMGLVISLCASLLLVTYAKAADKGGPKPAPPQTQDVFADLPVAKVTWTGVYVGGGVGYGSADGALTQGTHGIDGLAATGRTGGVVAGADWQLPGSFLVIGARAGYEWNDVAFTVSPGVFKASIDDGYFVGGRIGAAFGTALPYVVVDYVTMHTSASFGTVAISTPDMRGWRYGGGVEFRLPKVESGPFTPTLGVEVLYTNFDDKSFGPAAHPTKLDLTELTGMVRLNLHLGASSK